MFSKFINENSNIKKIIIINILFIIIAIIGILVLAKISFIDNLLKFFIGAIYLSILLVLVVLSNFVTYDNWCTSYIIKEISESSNKEKVILKYNVNLPIEKAFDVGYITKDTSSLSNILNIMGTVQLLILLFIFGFSYDIYNNYNLLGVIVACFINIYILILFLIVDCKNQSYIKIKKVIVEELQTVNIDTYDKKILKSKYKIFFLYIYIYIYPA